MNIVFVEVLCEKKNNQVIKLVTPILRRTSRRLVLCSGSRLDKILSMRLQLTLAILKPDLFARPQAAEVCICINRLISVCTSSNIYI